MLMLDAELALPAACREDFRHQPKEGALDQNRAMDRFLAEVERRAFRIALVSVRDRDEALDIVQDAMIRLVRTYGNRPSEEWRPLFFRILGNRITDQQRRQSVRRRVLAWFGPVDAGDDDSDPIANLPDTRSATPETEAAHQAAMRVLEVAVRELPARQREAFLLRSVEGLDVGETATAMGCTAGSVKTHYSRAVHSLRRVLGDHWP